MMSKPAQEICDVCKVAVMQKDKKDMSGTFLVNLDGSYHIVYAKGKRFHAMNKEHQEYIIKNNTDLGFITGAGPKVQKIGDLPKAEVEIERKTIIDLKDEKVISKLKKFKEILQEFDIIEHAVRQHLIDTGDSNPNPAKVGMMIKHVTDEWNYWSRSPT